MKTIQFVKTFFWFWRKPFAEIEKDLLRITAKQAYKLAKDDFYTQYYKNV